MSSNAEKIREFYSSGGEEGRADRNRSAEIEFHYTKKHLHPFIQADSRVLELGCGTGYYALCFAPQCAEYVGVDISPENIALFQKNIGAAGFTNIHPCVGDATALQNFADDSFDVVLALGPMYHLPREERQRVFEECRRVARDGAIAAFSYINGIGVYAGACVNWKDIYPNRKSNHYIFEKHTDDERPDVFFFTSPEEMEEDGASHGFSVIGNYGLDFFFEADAIDQMSEEQYACYLELADRMSASRSCTGLANHALLICRT